MLMYTLNIYNVIWQVYFNNLGWTGGRTQYLSIVLPKRLNVCLIKTFGSATNLHACVLTSSSVVKNPLVMQELQKTRVDPGLGRCIGLKGWQPLSVYYLENPWTRSWVRLQS